jgi:tRNA-dihydrouridine synthase B
LAISLLDTLADRLNRPLLIGRRHISGRLVLAPMTYLGHVAFRELLAGFGGFGLLFSEMCSAKRIPHENRFASAYFRWRDEELPHLVCQIVGETPEVMATAARVIEREGFFGVDINFGCAAAAICRIRCGAALLKEPRLAQQIVAAVRAAVTIPVWVKFRTGWQDDPDRAVDMARRFEDGGADALTFHPRVAPDRRARRPKWDYITRVKQAVDIPVFGNGDVFTPEACLDMLERTGCDGVAVGRMAVARPWIFAEWSDRRVFGPEVYLDTALELSRLLSKHFTPPRALRRFKRYARYFSANFRFGHTLFNRIDKAADMAAARQALQGFFADGAERGVQPNLNLLQ